MRPPARADAALRADGFGGLGRALDEPLLDAARVAFDLAVEHGGQPSEHGRIAVDAWPGAPALAACVDLLGPYVARLLGAPVLLFQETLVAKVAGAAELPWHQDYAYWPLDRPEGLTVWVALDDADEGNGCLVHAPGSHRHGERRPTWGLVEDDRRLGLPPPDPGLEDGAVPAPLLAGEALAHHPLTFHRSGPNPTGRTRRGWSTFWVTEDVRWDPGHSPHPRTAVDPPAAGSPLVGLPRFVPS